MKEGYDQIESILRFLDIFCRERTGGITFGDFMDFLSVISKGTTLDKLTWAFTFYDVDNDGVITKEEMLKVTSLLRLSFIDTSYYTTYILLQEHSGSILASHPSAPGSIFSLDVAEIRKIQLLKLK